MRSRTRALVALAVGGGLVLTACSNATGSDAEPATTSGQERVEVVAGFYPYAFVAERVGGDDVEVRNLTAPGAEPHDLELSPQQVASLSSADLVLYSKGFQPAVDVAVEQQAADRSFDVLSAVELRRYEDAHAEEEGEHAEEEGGDHADTAEDPHVWLDPTRLASIAEAVADQLGDVAPDRAQEFRERADALAEDLEALDRELADGLGSCARTEMVTSHDAFGYLAERYGLEQVAISGLSPEDEPSPRRLAEVAQFAQDREVTTIFFEELVSPRVAESLSREVGAQARVLSPLEGPPEKGDYLDAMRANLDTLRTALDCA